MKKKVVKKAVVVVDKVDVEKAVKVAKAPQEQFVPKREVERFKAMGYSVSELTENAGFSVPPAVRETYISAAKREEVVYMVK